MSILSERITGKIIEVDINSSNITSAKYDTETKDLTINFKSGFIYDFYDIPWELFTKFRLSESQGKFFNSQIKNKFKFKKLN